MTDTELMVYRFKNPHKDVTQLAKAVGMSREMFIDAVMRGMTEETKRSREAKNGDNVKCD